MANVFQKWGGKRAAAILAMEDGKEWNDLSEDEKEMYYSKAYQKKQDQQTTRPVGR